MINTDNLPGTLKAHFTELSASLGSSDDLFSSTTSALNSTRLPSPPPPFDKNPSGEYPLTPPPSDHSSAASNSGDQDNDIGVVTFSVPATPLQGLRKRRKGAFCVLAGNILS